MYPSPVTSVASCLYYGAELHITDGVLFLVSIILLRLMGELWSTVMTMTRCLRSLLHSRLLPTHWSTCIVSAFLTITVTPLKVASRVAIVFVMNSRMLDSAFIRYKCWGKLAQRHSGLYHRIWPAPWFRPVTRSPGLYKTTSLEVILDGKPTISTATRAELQLSASRRLDVQLLRCATTDGR